MAIRRYIETLLIWIRANFDNLVYTLFAINSFVAITMMLYGMYRTGLLIGFGGVIVFMLVIVWHE